MKSITTGAIAALLLTPVAAFAQTAPAAPAAGAPAAATPTPGAAIYDSAGVQIGTIESVTPQGAVVATGSAKVTLPLTAIGTGTKGLSIAMTKAQVDAAAAQAQAQAASAVKAQLVPGATVYGAGGTQVGTIKAADAQFVTLTTAKGEVKLPVAGFGAGPNGVVIGMTAAQLDAAISGAAAPAK